VGIRGHFPTGRKKKAYLGGENHAFPWQLQSTSTHLEVGIFPCIIKRICHVLLFVSDLRAPTDLLQGLRRLDGTRRWQGIEKHLVHAQSPTHRRKTRR